jgi:DNA polymerase elongation subunit (family B)
MTTTTTTMKIKKIVGKHFRLVDVQVNDRERKKDADSKAVKHFAIQLFGINEKGETASMLVNNYEPFFYVKLPDAWDNDSYASRLHQNLVEHKDLQRVKNAIVSVQLVKKNKLYGFSAGKLFNFALITFQNIEAMNKVKGLWYYYDEQSGQRKMKSYRVSGQSLEIYESSIPPILRYFNIQNISPSGWVFLHTILCTVPT